MDKKTAAEKSGFLGRLGQKKWIALLAAVVVIGGCIGGGVAFVNQKHADGRGNKAATAEQNAAEDKANGSKKTDEAAWKNAYRKILEDKKSLIESYEHPEYGDPRPAVSLCDIDGDGIPELFFMRPETSDYVAPADLVIYTYRNGKATPLEYGYPTYEDDSLDSGAPMQDVMAASGTSYVVFTLRSDNRLVISSNIGDEGGSGEICVYEPSGETELGGEFWKDSWKLDLEDGDSPSEVHTYYHGQKTITKDEYMQAAEALEKDMDHLLFYSPAGFAEELPFDSVSSMTPEAMFCADAIRKLTVEGGEKKGGSDENADDSILGELDGRTFAFASGAGGWDCTLDFGAGGTFKGMYHDSDMGSTGDDHPNGTRYECPFTGTFKEAKKTGDLEYTLTLEKIETEKNKGETTIEDGVLIEYTEPYGLDNLKPGDTVRLLLPGYPISGLTEDQRFWIAPFGAETEGPLKGYCLINEKSSAQGGALFYDGDE